MKAALNNYRQSPRKVALVAGLIRGKTAAQALIALRFATKRASSPVTKLLESALSNARNAGISDVETLIVKEIQVNKGVTLKRIMPRARGTAARINKRSCHVTLILAEAIVKPATKKNIVKAEKTEKIAKKEVKAVQK